jgi:hypothetical protein
MSEQSNPWEPLIGPSQEVGSDEYTKSQVGQILGMDPDELEAMSTQELYQLPMTQDQVSQLNQLLFPTSQN